MPIFDAVVANIWFRFLLVLMVFLSFGLYGLLNRPRKQIHLLITKFDGRIPFLPAFSIPYLLYFPYLFLIVGYGIMKTPYYLAIAASALAIQTAAAMIYLYCQTHVPRPDRIGRGIFSRLTSFIYWFDQPYNTFPSLHVAYSVFCAYWAWIILPGAFPVLVSLTVAIVFSTLFLKQHIIADVMSGILVASVSLYFVSTLT
ncbi:MAG: phosphatase PAP2 family protein [Patescibacteria group bacterium]